MGDRERLNSSYRFFVVVLVWSGAYCWPVALPAFGQQIQPHLDRSEQFFLDTRFEEAQALLDSVEKAAAEELTLADRLLLVSQRSEIEVFKGNLARDRTRYVAALAMLRPYQDKLSVVHDPGIRATFISALAYAHIFQIYVSESHRDTALDRYREAVQLYAETPDRSGEALARSLEIMLHFTRARSDHDTVAMLKLVPQFETEIAFARRAGNQIALAYNERHLAAIYREAAGELEKALHLYQISLENRLQSGFRAFVPASYSSVGDVLTDLGRAEDAIEMYKQSVKAADAVQFRRYQFSSRIKLGDLLKATGRSGLARSYYTEALEASEAEGVEEETDVARRRLDNLD